MPQPPENLREFSSLIRIVEDLRGPEGCPWDKEQTHQTLAQYAIEEVFELAEAMDRDHAESIVEELGDVLLQVVLNAEIGRQSGRFNILDVVEAICSKTVRRHPHVFGDAEAKTSEQAIHSFYGVKDKETKNQSTDGFIRFHIPKNLPALARSQKIGAKTGKYKFDWPSAVQVMEKVEEELNELKDVLREPEPDPSGLRHEIGDLLFSVAQLARHLGIDSEQALRQTNSRFESRWLKMQELAGAQGLEFGKLNEEQLEVLWSQAKKQTKADE